MKKSAFAAGLLAVAIMLSACSEKETTKSKKTKKTTKEMEDTTDPEEDPTADPIDVPPETEDPTETEDPGTTASESTGNPTGQTPTTSDPAVKPEDLPDPTFDFDEDPLSFYKDDSYRLPDFLYTFAVPENGAWSITILFYLDDNTFSGDYESSRQASDGESWDVSYCTFEGTIDGFTRVNDYTFKANVTSFNVPEFEPYDEDGFRGTRHVSFAEPYGFEEPDELYLYLPNTPMSELPGEAKGRIGHMLREEDSEYLQDCVLYSGGGVNHMGLIVSENSIPETVAPTKENMEHWLGSYDDGEGTVYTVYYDDGAGGFFLDGKFDGKVEFKGAKVRCYKYDEQSLIIYAVNDDGYVLFEMSMADGLVVISSLYSSVTRLPAGSFYYPSKTS